MKKENSIFISDKYANDNEKLLKMANVLNLENKRKNLKENKDYEIKTYSSDNITFSDEIVLFIKNLIANQAIIVKFVENDLATFIKYKSISEIFNLIANNDEILKMLFVNPNSSLSKEDREKNIQCFEFFKKLKENKLSDDNLKANPLQLIIGFGTFETNIKLIIEEENIQIIFHTNEFSDFFSVESETEAEEVWDNIILKIIQTLQNIKKEKAIYYSDF